MSRDDHAPPTPSRTCAVWWVVIVTSLSGVAACGSSTTPTTSTRGGIDQTAWRVRSAGGAQPIDPGAAPDTLLDPEACRACHAPIVDEWRGSRHAQAWTNSIFRTEYDARPQAWCVNCHAPLTTQQRSLRAGDESAADRGVDCATCHVRRGALVSARRRPASPHDTVEDATFGSPTFCADCHEFTFPVLDEGTGAASAMTRHPMQTTVSSFLSGRYAREPAGCATCHATTHGHGFPGAHSLPMLQLAFDVDWCRDAERIVVSVSNSGAGHAIPSGDIHRHVYVRVWRSTAPESLFQAFLGRRFEDADDGGKRTIWDSTIAPWASRTYDVALADLGGEPDEPLNLEATYVYIEDEHPSPRRGLTEPATRSIQRERRELADLRVCPGAAAARLSPR